MRRRLRPISGTRRRSSVSMQSRLDLGFTQQSFLLEAGKPPIVQWAADTQLLTLSTADLRSMQYSGMRCPTDAVLGTDTSSRLERDLLQQRGASLPLDQSMCWSEVRAAGHMFVRHRLMVLRTELPGTTTPSMVLCAAMGTGRTFNTSTCRSAIAPLPSRRGRGENHCSYCIIYGSCIHQTSYTPMSACPLLSDRCRPKLRGLR